ncbi:c-type cytochrome [Roseobacter sinensis]|uniref:C-type cytochrome n=1 Tax=Roseobacter sinensis TaxID=2931391 RepID=A0ABT3BHS4_9RHOB|nr:c-type cytochrome [Roseobacter sp. WL0113]MCV3272934.1 c-type cytochrome [Roseobacter sp. WL0113]
MRFVLMLMMMALTLAACGRERGETGAALYAANCAICHGADARGGGGGGVDGLSKTPPDLTGLALRNGGIFPADHVLTVLDSYGLDGRHWPQMSALPALQSENRARVRVGNRRVRTSVPNAALLIYLESVQAS